MNNQKSGSGVQAQDLLLESKNKDSLRWWRELNPVAKAGLISCLVVLAVFLPEISILLDFAGLEVTVLFIFYYLKPTISLVRSKLQQIGDSLELMLELARASSAATARGYSFSLVSALVITLLTSSVILGAGAWLPALMIQGSGLA